MLATSTRGPKIHNSLSMRKKFQKRKVAESTSTEMIFHTLKQDVRKSIKENPEDEKF